MRLHHMRNMLRYLSLFSALLLTLVMFGCEGDDGENGTSFGTVTGTVTDTFGNKVAGATVAPTPTVIGVANASTDANGVYSLTLPNGNYTLTFSKSGYVTQTLQMSIVATQTDTRNVVLTPNAGAALNIANAQFNQTTGTATFTANAVAFDPALQGQPVTFTFRDAAGNVIPGNVTTGNSSTLNVTQPAPAQFVANVAELAKVRQSVYPEGHDPVADENDFDVPDFETLDRLQVLPIAQHAFEGAADTSYKVYAQFGSSAFNTYSTSVVATVPTNTLPFVPNAGIRNVPVGQPVVLQGKIQSTYNWTVAAPVGSNLTALLDPTTRFPHFIPDAPGVYTITEDGSGTTRTINIYAGRYVGILLPAPNDDPLGIIDTSCSQAGAGGGCHSSTAFNTPFQNGVQFFSTTPINSVFGVWDQSGHRSIMVQAMSEDPSHYSIDRCAKCHSVGFTQYSSAIRSDGFKDVARASGFTDAAFRANAPTFFAGPAGRFDQVLRLSEAQCETCHGPNGTGSAHGQGTADAISARFSLSADVCAPCHGEPLRHGRYQEWRGSGHGDFQTAILEGVSGITTANPNGTGPNVNCAGCHTGQGFPLLLAQLQGTGGNTQSPLRSLNAANVAALSFLRADNVQPQTCATCHPVHNPGTESGLVGAIVILRGDYQAGGAFQGTTPLLPGGFQANGVGKGALCITCHNSRNGGVAASNTATLHEDGDPNFGALTGYSAPHEACQGDVLMGRNAYFFSSPVAGEDLALPGFTKVPQIGQRSAHSFLADTCVTCHLQKAQADPELGYPPDRAGAGTNHSFGIVTNRLVPAPEQVDALCAQCHGGFSGSGLMNSFNTAYRNLIVAAGNAALRLKYGSIANATAAGVTNITFIPGRSPQVSIAGAAPVTLASFLANGVGTVNTGPIPANGFQRDLAKANWNIALVAPRYFVTQLDSSSFDNGTPILNATGGEVQVTGDDSKSIHNPSFVFNVMSVTQARLNAL